MAVNASRSPPDGFLRSSSLAGAPCRTPFTRRRLRFLPNGVTQGEVSEIEFWEGLQAVGIAHDLPRCQASHLVERFKVGLGVPSGRGH